MITPAAVPPAGAVHIIGDTYYLPGLTNSGYVRGLLIDTGPEPEPYAASTFDSLVITHGHADHFSVAAELRRQGARVYAARDDARLVENPEVNIRGMFSWAKPSNVLVTKLFLGKPCAVDGYLEEWRDERATAIPLRGHTLGHHAVLTADGTLFTGDALYLEELWSRHPLPYSIDPGDAVRSLEILGDIEFRWLVPAHGRPVRRDEAMRHIEHHLEQLRRIEAYILGELKDARTTEEIIALVSRERGLSDNPAQYWLAVTTVKGFLGELLGRGEIEFFVREHSGWWLRREAPDPDDGSPRG